MGDDTRVILVRHGESRAQAEGFLSGHDTCTGLSELGRRQATALRDRLLATGEFADVAAVYTSILPRAQETAEIIRPGLAGREIVSECEFCEIHAGEGEGLTWPEFEERYPRKPDALDNPYQQRMPGAETWAQFYVRAGTRLRRVAEEHAGERVLVVCHGGVVGASFVALGDVPMRMAADLMSDCRNTSITEWRLDGGRRWRLDRFNDHAHLSAGA